MKQEIQKILEMNKAGQLTDDQAAELIAELSHQKNESASTGRANERESATGADSRPRAGATETGEESDGDGEECLGFFGRRARRWARWHQQHHERCHRGHRGGHGRFGGGFAYDDSHGNTVNLSKLSPPKGRDFKFEKNSVQVSAVDDLTLESAEFTGNTIEACKFADAEIRDGRFFDCELQGSSIHDFVLERAEFSAIKLMGAKFHDFEMRDGQWTKSTLVGVALKDLKISERSKLHELSFEGAAIADVEFKSASFAHSRVSEVRISDAHFVESTLEGLRLQRVKVLDTELLRSRLKNVEFTGTGGGWRASGLYDTRIENCAFTDVVFRNCRFTDAVILNVNLEGLEIADVEFTGKIDGNEAFLKAAKIAPKGQAS